MITYKLVNDTELNTVCSITKKIDGVEVMSIPLADDNTDYQGYLAWVAEGNTIAEAD